MADIKYAKTFVHVNSLVPLAMLGWDFLHKNLGPNPVEFLTRTTGALTLVFLLLSLAVTPFRKAAGVPWMVKLRRIFGLYAFLYASLHLLTFVWFDKSFNLGAIIKETLKRPYITFGMSAFLILVPLALTSTNGMIKRLGGKRWNRLHKTIYAAGVLGVLHYYALVKADIRIPIAFGIVLAVFLLYRVVDKYFPQYVERAKPRAKPVRQPAE